MDADDERELTELEDKRNRLVEIDREQEQLRPSDPADAAPYRALQAELREIGFWTEHDQERLEELRGFARKDFHVGDRVRNKEPRYRTAFVVETLEMTRGTEQQGRVGVRYEVTEQRGWVSPQNLKKISRHKEAK